MPILKAIETRYAGCRFRSRLEARWAVFFDTLGEPWEYEKEGFELPSGRYLPDFWLPNLNAWFETKGKTPTTHEIELAADVSAGLNQPFVIAHGTPGMHPLCVLAPSGGLVPSCEGRFAVQKDRLVVVCTRQVNWDLFVLGDLANKPLGSFTPTAAINAAKSARFEFGR